jgi:hypothetical protein
MTLAKAKAKTNETLIVQVSVMIGTYNRQNMFIVQATGVFVPQKFQASRNESEFLVICKLL